MDEITGALVGIALVLTAVFLPMAFFGGSTGVIYRQFSITIVVGDGAVGAGRADLHAGAVRDDPEAAERGSRGGASSAGSTGPSTRANRRYVGVVKRVVAHPLPSLLLFGGIVAVLVVVFLRIPGGFLPDEDQGVLFIQVTGPPGATAIRTEEVLDEVADYFRKSEASNIEGVLTVDGFSFGGQGQNSGLAFVKLTDWSKRPGAANKVQAIAGRAQAHFASIKDAQVFAFAPPAVLELGNATGFDFELQDQANKGHDALMAARNQLLGEAAKDQRLMAVRPNGLNDEPQYSISIDREKANAQSLSLADINTTLSAAWGSAYVNDFIDRGRVKRVFMQGEPNSRMLPDELNDWYVRNSLGQMVPFSSFATGKWTYRLAEARAVQRRAVGGDTGGAGAGAEQRDGDPGDGGTGEEAAGGVRLRMDRAFVRGAAIGVADAGICMRVR